MAQVDVRLVRILQSLKTKTADGDIEWTPAGAGYMYNAESFAATIESDVAGGSGPYRLQLHDSNGRTYQEIQEADEDAPGMDVDWRADLARLYSLAGRANPRQEDLLKSVARELGLD